MFGSPEIIARDFCGIVYFAYFPSVPSRNALCPLIHRATSLPERMKILDELFRGNMNLSITS